MWGYLFGGSRRSERNLKGTYVPHIENDLLFHFFKGTPTWKSTLRPGGMGGAATADRIPHNRYKLAQNSFCFKLDAKSVPEALATTILILLKFSIVLAHRWNPGVWPHPAPSGTPHRHPWAPLVTPRCPWDHGGGRTPPEFRHPKNNNPIIVSILLRGAEFGMGGGGPSNSANRRIFQ